MKKQFTKTILLLSILFVQNRVLSQQVEYISGAEFEDIEYFTERIEGYPKDKLPRGAKEIYIRIADDGQKAQLILKLNEGYEILPFEKSEFSYNYAKKSGAEYRNGFVYITSIMPYSSSSSTGVFKIAGKDKLIFIKEEYDAPNEDIETSAEDALAKGDIKTAADLYMETTYPPLNFYEVTQEKLLKRAHEVALKQFKAKEYKKAAETMGYAYDFWDIDLESDMYFDKKMVSILADYTYFLEKAKMYDKCIKVSEAFTLTVIDVAGPYMHLGDSYYHTDKKQEALKAYKKYCALRKKQGQENRIPTYVKTRIAELDVKTKTFTDSRDGKIYKLVTIGGFTIMAENFTYKPDGKGYMAYDNDQSNVSKFGYLYTYETAQTICPKGWHIPTKEEYEKLLKLVGKTDSERYSSLIAGGESGFDALYGGRYEKEYNNFQFINERACFWTSTPSYQERYWFLNIDSYYETIDFSHFSKEDCRSVRYFKD